MKKIYFLASFLTFAAISVNAQENLIENGDFENWTEANPENFDEVGTEVLYNDLITKETTISMSGNSAKQQAKAQGTTQYLEYSFLIPVTPGHTYTISYWYLDNDNHARTRLWSTWLNGSNDPLATELQGNIQEQPYSTDNVNWVQKTKTVTAPEGAVKIRYQIRTYHQDGTGGGFIYYDDLFFSDNGPLSVIDNATADFVMYPNPLSGDVLNISSATNSDMEVSIYDMVGKQVLTSKVVNGTVNVSGLNAGIYAVTIAEEGKTSVKRLVVK